jgi:hypothetical protein
MGLEIIHRAGSAAGGVAANDLWELRTGRRQAIEVAVREAAATLRVVGYTMRREEDGRYRRIPMSRSMQHMVTVTQPWPTADGRWFLPHFNLPAPTAPSGSARLGAAAASAVPSAGTAQARGKFMGIASRIPAPRQQQVSRRGPGGSYGRSRPRRPNRSLSWTSAASASRSRSMRMASPKTMSARARSATIVPSSDRAPSASKMPSA